MSQEEENKQGSPDLGEGLMLEDEVDLNELVGEKGEEPNLDTEDKKEEKVNEENGQDVTGGEIEVQTKVDVDDNNNEENKEVLMEEGEELILDETPDVDPNQVPTLPTEADNINSIQDESNIKNVEQAEDEIIEGGASNENQNESLKESIERDGALGDQAKIESTENKDHVIEVVEIEKNEESKPEQETKVGEDRLTENVDGDENKTPDDQKMDEFQTDMEGPKTASSTLKEEKHEADSNNLEEIGTDSSTAIKDSPNTEVNQDEIPEVNKKDDVINEIPHNEIFHKKSEPKIEEVAQDNDTIKETNGVVDEVTEKKIDDPLTITKEEKVYETTLEFNEKPVEPINEEANPEERSNADVSDQKDKVEVKIVANEESLVDQNTVEAPQENQKVDSKTKSNEKTVIAPIESPKEKIKENPGIAPSEVIVNSKTKSNEKPVDAPIESPQQNLKMNGNEKPMDSTTSFQPQCNCAQEFIDPASVTVR